MANFLLWHAAAGLFCLTRVTLSLPLAGDDECWDANDADSCVLNALQRQGVKLQHSKEESSISSRKSGMHKDESLNISLASWNPHRRRWFSWGSKKEASATEKHAINLWNDKLDHYRFEGEGLYFEFRTEESDKVFSGTVEGRIGSYSHADTQIPVASLSKLFTAVMAMITMELKPTEFYPEKLIHEFKGYEGFKNMKVNGEIERANLTIHHLLTHSSGIPFMMRASVEDIMKAKLFFHPGTGYGYTIGHRVIGWIMRDFWKDQPEAKGLEISTVNDCYKWILFDKMGLKDTHFDDKFVSSFGYTGEAGDAAITTTANDLMKLAVMALRKGRLQDGFQLISEKNWNKWALPNLLPGGKFSKDLVGWAKNAATWANFNVGHLKEGTMRSGGEFGWNYFGATWNNGREIGWCGFFSACLRVSYDPAVAFVMMQRDVSDLKDSKTYLEKHIHEMAESLVCKHTTKCKDDPEVLCERNGQDVELTPGCPMSTTRGKGWHRDTQLDPNHHSCFVPRCQTVSADSADSLDVECVDCGEETAPEARISEKPSLPSNCQDLSPGMRFYNSVKWAKEQGIHEHPDWYPGLTPSSRLSAFQSKLHADYDKCPPPCTNYG